MNPKSHTSKIFIGRMEFVFISEMANNKEVDTKVTTDGGTLCFISGQEKDEFIKEFKALIEKYRI